MRVLGRPFCVDVVCGCLVGWFAEIVRVFWSIRLVLLEGEV